MITIRIKTDLWCEDLIPVNPFSRPGDLLQDVKKVVWHYTANPGPGDEPHKRYFEGLKNQNPNDHKPDRYASAHLFIDRDSATLIIPLHERAIHAGNWLMNKTSIGVELCIEKDGTFHPNTIARAIKVGALFCSTFRLDPLKDNIRHYDVTGKICPKPWVDHPELFMAFKSDVKRAMLALAAKPPQTDPPSVIVMVNGKRVADGYITPSGRAMVPLRDVANAVDYAIGWTAAGLTINGKPYSASDDVLVAGKTYMPLRSIAEALGATFSWDNKTKTARITK